MTNSSAVTLFATLAGVLVGLGIFGYDWYKKHKEEMLRRRNCCLVCNNELDDSQHPSSDLSVVRLPCSHQYHKKCWKMIQQTSQNGPVCCPSCGITIPIHRTPAPFEKEETNETKADNATEHDVVTRNVVANKKSQCPVCEEQLDDSEQNGSNYSVVTLPCSHKLHQICHDSFMIIKSSEKTPCPVKKCLSRRGF